MTFPSLDAFLTSRHPALAKGPLAMVLLEDEVEAASTLRHHVSAGFRHVVAFCAADIILPEELDDSIVRVTVDMSADDILLTIVNSVIARMPGEWLYYCYNSEYLFYPFCENRTVGEMLAFHTEERRNAMLTYVIDLYAADLGQHPNAVSLDDAHLDKSGYYALARHKHGKEFHERQLDFFGGLRWRFEEHVPWKRRRIDRIGLFRARKGLELRADHTFNDEEYNTYACPWHHNLTAAICSFRTAKALKRNPGSGYQISTFHWRNSTRFDWHSQQLMDLGLMEPGQWF